MGGTPQASAPAAQAWTERQSLGAPISRLSTAALHRLAALGGSRYFAHMSPTPAGEQVTALLARWRAGDRSVLDALLPLVYADLRRIASSQLRRHEGHATLQTTALVHDVLIRLLDRPAADFETTTHLLNTAARIMRQLLVNRARDAATQKRGGGWLRDALVESLELPIPDQTDLVELDQALNELEAFDARMAKVLELRLFVGLGMAEIAASLDIVERTAQRDWVSALAWLKTRLGGDQ